MLARHWLKIERSAGGKWLVTIESSDKGSTSEFIELNTSQAVGAVAVKWCEVIEALAAARRLDG